MRRFLIIIAIFLIIAILATILILKGQKPKEIKTAEVARKDLVLTVSASGEVKSETVVSLKFQTSGLLAWVGVKKGDYVKKWQVIASLDKRELEKALKKELIDYMNERWDFEEDRQTYNVTTDDLDKNTLSNSIRRLLEKAQFDLDRDVLDVEIAHLAVDLATIVSPIEGIVTNIDVPIAGVNITPAQATFTVADPQKMVFEASVDEVDVGGIKEGQKAILSLDAYPDEEIESGVVQVNFESVTTRGGGTAFPVKIKLPENKELKFKLGMNGDVEIILEKKENTFAVPSSAIMRREDKHYVFVVVDKVAKIQKVKIGLETETETEILEGIGEGDEVIIEKFSQIKDGQKVK